MNAVLTNMCMLQDPEGRVLVQYRLPKKDNPWSGLTFPGGHVEPGESITDSMIREFKEETGLTLDRIVNCGFVQWFNPVTESQYIIFCFKSKSFSGRLKSSSEGKMEWMTIDCMRSGNLAPCMQKYLDVFCVDDAIQAYGEAISWAEVIQDKANVVVLTESRVTEISRRKFCAKVAATMAVGAMSNVIAETDGDGREVLAGQARKKRSLGQFFTEGACWLQPQVADFIRSSMCEIAYDPFAGSGCLFTPVTNAIHSISKCEGLDIDSTLGWPQNDSLIRIPHKEGAIIITNPPYISNYSASRKRLGANLKKYFDTTLYDDVYLLALDKMLEAQKNVVAIIPETFINSPYKQKHLLSSITILEENPFFDTDTPVVVVCFDSVEKEYDKIRIYKGQKYVCSLHDVEQCRLTPNGLVKMKFNNPDGWLGVRCVDSTNPDDMLRFDYKDNIDYDWEKGIKVSSRLLTLVSIDVPKSKRDAFIAECNRILKELRANSHDIVFSPFKGNMKNGVRRRRLDFQTCRAIIEMAFLKIVSKNSKAIQADLFKEVK